jgi:hypothetical protein
VVFMGLVVATVTATLGIALPLVQAAHDTQVANLQRDAQVASQQLQNDNAALQAQITSLLTDKSQLQDSLSGIQRVLGGDSQQLDVSRLVVTQDQARDLPPQASFFAGDSFYALDPTKVEGWTLDRATTELRLQADQTGVSEATLRQSMIEAGFDPDRLTRFPLYLWRRPAVATVEGFPGVKALYTQVFVQRASIKDVLGIVGGTTVKQPDGLLALLASELAGELSMGGQFLSGLQTIEQKNDTVYARFESALSDVTVDGEKLSQYYWTRELLVVTTPDSYYLIRTFLPNKDHRSPDFANFTQWFEDFAVLSGA